MCMRFDVFRMRVFLCMLCVVCVCVYICFLCIWNVLTCCGHCRKRCSSRQNVDSIFVGHVQIEKSMFFLRFQVCVLWCIPAAVRSPPKKRTWICWYILKHVYVLWSCLRPFETKQTNNNEILIYFNTFVRAVVMPVGFRNPQKAILVFWNMLKYFYVLWSCLRRFETLNQKAILDFLDILCMRKRCFYWYCWNLNLILREHVPKPYK